MSRIMPLLHPAAEHRRWHVGSLQAALAMQRTFYSQPKEIKLFFSTTELPPITLTTRRPAGSAWRTRTPQTTRPPDSASSGGPTRGPRVGGPEGQMAMSCRTACVFCSVYLWSVPAVAENDLLPSITVDPTNISVKLELVGTTTTLPTDIVRVPDASGRMFMTMTGGDIRVIGSGGSILDTRFHATQSADSYYQGDAQFTTMAFHPDFAASGEPGYGKFYTLEPEKKDAGPYDFVPDFGTNEHSDALYEYTVSDISANTFSGTKRLVLRAQQPGHSHNFNDLLFGSDHMLYIATGDGWHGNVTHQNSQLLTNAYGKILRIDPLGLAGTVSPNGQYSIPVDNPYHDGAGPRQDEIWAYGLRNPFRMSFDDPTGDLWIGDVGEEDIEEVDVIEASADAGLNFGWSEKEGSFLYPDLIPDPDLDGNNNGDMADAHGWTDPVLEYDHQDGANVTGGFVYRGAAIPQLAAKYVFADYQGNRDSDPISNFARLFYADTSTGEIFQAVIDEQGVALPERLVGFGQDAAGELYLLGSPKDFSMGQVFRVLPDMVVRTGDMDCDGDVDFDDIDDLVLGLNDPAGYEDQLGVPPALKGDADGDGDLDFDDIDDFVAVLTNPSTSAAKRYVPEPSSLATAVLAAWVLLAVGWRR